MMRAGCRPARMSAGKNKRADNKGAEKLCGEKENPRGPAVQKPRADCRNKEGRPCIDTAAERARCGISVGFAARQHVGKHTRPDRKSPQKAHQKHGAHVFRHFEHAV